MQYVLLGFAVLALGKFGGRELAEGSDLDLRYYAGVLWRGRWLVVVAAEMIAINSGLGYLIIDSRNAGNRYDLVIAGMIIIGVIGLLLDHFMQRLERLRMVQWRYGH